MIRLNLQTVVVAGLVYWFFFRRGNTGGGIEVMNGKNGNSMGRGEGYP